MLQVIVLSTWVVLAGPSFVPADRSQVKVDSDGSIHAMPSVALSLVQNGMKTNDQQSQVTEQNEKINDINTDLTADWQAAQTKITTKSADIQAKQKGAIDDLNIKVKVQGDKIEDQATSQTDAAVTVVKAGNEVTANIATMAGDITKMKSDSVDMMVAIKSEEEDEQEAKVQETKDQIMVLNDEVTKTASETSLNAQVASKDTVEEADAGMEEITQVTDDTAVMVGEEEEQMGEVSGEALSVVKGIRKDSQKLIGGANSQVQKIEREAKSTEAGFQSEAVKVERAAEKGVNEVLKETKSEIKGMGKEKKAEAKDMKSDAKEQIKDAGTTEKELMKEILGMSKDIDADEKEKLADMGDEEAGQEQVLTTLATTAEELNADQEGVFNSGEAKLGATRDALEGQLAGVGASFSASVAKSTQKNRQEINEASDKNYADRQSAANAATASILDKTTEVEKAVTVAKAEASFVAGDIANAVGVQGKEIKNNEAMLDANQVGVANGIQAIQVLSKDCEDLANTTLSEVEEQRKATEEGVDEDAATALANTKAEANQATQTTQAAANSAQVMLVGTIEDMEKDNTRRIENMKQSLMGTAGKMDQNLKEIGDDVTKVQGINEQVQKELPKAKAMGTNAVETVQAELLTVQNSLTKTQQELGETLDKKKTEADNEIADVVNQVEAKLQQDVTGTQQSVSEEMAQTAGLGQQLSAALKRDEITNKETSTENAEQINLVNTKLQELEQSNQGKGTQIKEEVINLQQEVIDSARSTKRSGLLIGTNAADEAQTSFTSAAGAAAQEAKDAEASASATMEKAQEDAVIDLAAQQAEIENQDDKKRAELAQVEATDQNLSEKFKTEEENADSIASTLANEMKGLKATQAKVTTSVHEAVENEEETIDKEKAQLASQINKQIGDNIAEEKAQVDDMKNAEATKLAEVKTENSLKKSHAESNVRSFTMHMNGDLEQVALGIKGVGNNLNTLEGDAHEATVSVAESTGELNQAVEQGADILTVDKNKGAAEVAKLEGGQLDSMSGLVGGLKAADGKANAEMEHMSVEFNEKTKFLKQQAEGQIAGIAEELNNVANNPYNAAGVFAADTEDTRNSLKDSLNRLHSSEGRTNDLVTNLDKRLAEVAAERVKMAEKIHGEVTAMKSNAAASAGTAVTQIDEMSAEAERNARNMTESLRQFEQQMSGVSGAAEGASHDQAKVDDLDKQLFSLKGLYERLQNWMLHNRHRMHAWRHEVDKQLKNMQSSIGIEADGIKNEQTSKELDLNEKLRGMQLTLEEKMSKSNVNQAQYFKGLVKGTMSGMDKMMSDEEKQDMLKASQEKQADAQLLNNQKMMDGEVNSVGTNEAALQAQADELQTNMEVAMNEIKGQTFLPSLTADKKNVDANTQVQIMKTQINKLSSLLETGSISTAESQLRGRDAAEDQAEQQEEQAVMQLNQELQRENAKLASENTNLEKGLSKLKL